MGTRAVEAVHAGSVGDEDRIGAADEKSAFDRPDNASDALLELRRIGDRTETTVENAVTAIGDEGLIRARQAQSGAGAEHLELFPGCIQPERDDFHRNRNVRTQPVHQLNPIDDDYEAPARGSNDFLT